MPRPPPVDEKSVESFRRAVGSIYHRVPGKGDRWLKDDLDLAIEQMTAPAGTVRDIADVL